MTAPDSKVSDTVEPSAANSSSSADASRDVADDDELQSAAAAGGGIDNAVRHRLISEAAFRRYEQRGRADGHELDDWLQAEAEIDHVIRGVGAGGALISE